MGYNARNRFPTEDEYKGIGYDVDDEYYDDCDDDADDDMQEYIAEVEERVDRLKEITVSAVNKRDRLGKALMISVGLNIITTAAAIALCCGSPKIFSDAFSRRRG